MDQSTLATTLSRLQAQAQEMSDEMGKYQRDANRLHQLLTALSQAIIAANRSSQDAGAVQEMRARMSEFAQEPSHYSALAHRLHEALVALDVEIRRVAARMRSAE